MSKLLVGIPDKGPMTIIRPKRPKPRSLHYYDLKKNWRKVARVIKAKPALSECLVRDLDKYS